MSLKKSKPRFSPQLDIKTGVLRGYCGGYGPKIMSWALGPSEEATWLIDPHFKPYHDREIKKGSEEELLLGH